MKFLEGEQIFNDRMMYSLLYNLFSSLLPLDLFMYLIVVRDWRYIKIQCSALAQVVGHVPVMVTLA